MPRVSEKRGIALKRKRPSEIGTTINTKLDRSRVAHASSNNRKMRRNNWYLQKKKLTVHISHS